MYLPVALGRLRDYRILKVMRMKARFLKYFPIHLSG